MINQKILHLEIKNVVLSCNEITYFHLEQLHTGGYISQVVTDLPDGVQFNIRLDRDKAIAVSPLLPSSWRRFQLNSYFDREVLIELTTKHSQGVLIKNPCFIDILVNLYERH